MHNKFRSLSRLAAAIVVAATSLSAHAMYFVKGDTYTSNYFSRTINHYDASGKFVDSMIVPSNYGSQVKGLTFGNDGLLYAVTVQNSGFGVIALDQAGHVEHSYTGPGYIGSNLSYGKITFGANGNFYVAAADSLVEFTPGSSTGKVISQSYEYVDSALMPSGDLLTLSAYGIKEVTATGSFVRSINPNIMLTDARGIAYDASTNDIYVSMIGDTSDLFRLLRIDGTTGKVEKNVSFWYADDLYLTSDDRLLVGSRTLAPEFFDLDLNPLSSLGTQQQMFVTMDAVPEPSEFVLIGSGMFVLLGLTRRRAAKKSSH